MSTIEEDKKTRRCKMNIHKIVFATIFCIFISAAFIYQTSYFDVTEKNKHDYDREIFGNKFEAKKCEPVKHIFYPKPAKCASSTIAALLTRFALINDLSFVPVPIGKSTVNVNDIPQSLRTPNSKYDILARHCKMTQQVELRQLMHADAVWITSLREPVSRFESQFSYLKLDKRWGKTLPELLSDPSQIKISSHNFMASHLGLWNSTTQVVNSNFLSEADKMFDLVLIVEHLDESLILLRHRLCWALDDVVGLRMKKRDQSWRTQLSKKEKNAFRSISTIDIQLYEYFLSKHKLEVKKFGTERMANEVKMLQSRRKEFENICGFTKKFEKVKKTMVNTEQRGDKKHQNSSNINFSHICHLMTLDVPDLSDLVLSKQKKFIRQGLLE